MDWTTEALTKKAKIFNRIYFNNEIKYPIVIKWSRHLFNADSSTNAHHRFINNTHVITFNVTYQCVSEEMMRSTLVHEMIHAWQSEYDDDMYSDWSKYKGHGPAFLAKCDELNQKFKFTYPLTRYTAGNKLKQLNKQKEGAYFVYKQSYYIDDDGTKVEFPIGCFVKFLLSNEIAHLLRNGLLVKFLRKPIFSNKCKYSALRGKSLDNANGNWYVTYSALKKITAIDFLQSMCDAGYRSYLFDDDDFNFETAINAEV